MSRGVEWPSTSPWRSIARRQWPIAAVLCALLAAEATTLTGGPGELHVWQLPLIALITVVSLLAPLYPVGAALTVTALMTAETVLTVVLQTPGPPFVGGMSLTELAAAAAAAAVVTRAPRGRPAVTAATALVVAVAMASNLRPVFRVVESSSSDMELQGVLVVAVAITAGLYLRQRDRDQASVLSASISAARQSERLALARELHDLVAHHVTGILVQVKAAQRIAGTRPEAAGDILPAIETSGTEAMIAMRRLVQALRRADLHSSDPAPHPDPVGTGDLADDLRHLAERSAVPVSVAMHAPDQLPPEIAGSVLRIVREALTNVDKHAQRPCTAHVDVGMTRGSVHVCIRDDGTRPSEETRGRGYGLVGMRERVELLGGCLQAGWTATGWEVRADLPANRNTDGGS